MLTWEKPKKREDKVFLISAIPNSQIYHLSKVTDIVNHGYLWIVFTLSVCFPPLFSKKRKHYLKTQKNVTLWKAEPVTGGCKMMPGFIFRTVRLGGQCLNWRGTGILRRWTRSPQRGGVTIWGQTEAVTLTCEPSIVFSRLLKKEAAEVSGGREKSGEALDRVAGGGSQSPSKSCRTRASTALRDLKLAHV